MNTSYKCIEAAPSSWNGVSIVYASVAHSGLKPIENAGRAVSIRFNQCEPHSEHHRVTSIRLAKAAVANAAAKSKLASSRHSAPSHIHTHGIVGGRKVKYHSSNTDLTNLYALLHIEHLGIWASEKQIRKAYREVSMLYHPDKHGGADFEHAETVYKAIQTAHSTLSESKKRRAYDSTLEFDDSIPAERLPANADFFEVFGPVMKRNARFSIIQPVPSFGDASTPLTDIDNLYNFWYSMKSWRDFEIENAHNPDTADRREERRWMERENEKKKVLKRKAEAVRMRKLVDRAFNLDPRVKALRAMEKQRKKDMKRAKNAAKFGTDIRKDKNVSKSSAADVEAKQVEADEKEALAVAMKAKKQEEKKIMRKARQAFRSAFNAHSVFQDYINIDYVNEELLTKSLEEIAEMCVVVETGNLNSVLRMLRLDEVPDAPPAEAVGDRNQPSSSHHDDDDDGKQQQHVVVVAPQQHQTGGVAATDNAVMTSDAQWTLDDLSKLAKAMSKYPGGTPDRWACIAKHIGSSYSEAELINKARELHHHAQRETTSNEAAFAQYHHNTKMKVDKVKRDARKGDAVCEFVEPTTHNDDDDDGEDDDDDGEDDGDESSQWTMAQHQSFEDALRIVPKHHLDRWMRIAALVDGKTQKQCLAHYEHVRQTLNTNNATRNVRHT